jgi:hypothetical protein
MNPTPNVASEAEDLPLVTDMRTLMKKYIEDNIVADEPYMGLSLNVIYDKLV